MEVLCELQEALALPCVGTGESSSCKSLVHSELREQAGHLFGVPLQRNHFSAQILVCVQTSSYRCSRQCLH